MEMHHIDIPSMESEDNATAGMDLSAIIHRPDFPVCLERAIMCICETGFITRRRQDA